MFIRRLLRRLIHDNHGVAAVEFGLLLPAMAISFIGTIEVTQLISAQSRVTSAAQCMADNIARYGASLGTTLTNTQLQAMGEGVVSMLSPGDSGSNVASTNTYMGAMMLVRDTKGTTSTADDTVKQETTWTITSPSKLRDAYKGTAAVRPSDSELTSTFSGALGLTDTSGGVVYVAVRYQYNSVFSVFFSTTNLGSDAFAKQRWGTNVLFNAAA